MADFMEPAFSAFDAYTVLMMVLVGAAAAFTMRTFASIITATIAALAVFATAVFAREVLSAQDPSVVALNDWNSLLTLQFSTLSVYALVVGAIVASSYGLLVLTRR
jgi:hypothetical protein